MFHGLDLELAKRSVLTGCFRRTRSGFPVYRATSHWGFWEGFLSGHEGVGSSLFADDFLGWLWPIGSSASGRRAGWRSAHVDGVMRYSVVIPRRFDFGSGRMSRPGENVIEVAGRLDLVVRHANPVDRQLSKPRDWRVFSRGRDAV